jgi:hypothetical protein
VEEKFSMSSYETAPSDEELEYAAIAATLVAHRNQQLATQVVAPGKRDASNWKWMTRYERMHR